MKQEAPTKTFYLVTQFTMPCVTNLTGTILSSRETKLPIISITESVNSLFETKYAIFRYLFIIVFFFLYVTVPKVKLVGKGVIGKTDTSVNVSWEIEDIHKRLKNPQRFNLHYCPVENCTSYTWKNITSSKRSAVISGLITYAEYKFKVKAVGITARDGTKMLFPEGNFSHPFNGRTMEGGKN